MRHMIPHWVVLCYSDSVRKAFVDPLMTRIVFAFFGFWLVSDRAVAEAKCSELEGAKPQVQLEYLQRERTAQSPDCITYAMFQIASSRGDQDFDRYPEAIHAMVGYLDYHPPNRSVLSQAVSGGWSRYPATDALFMFGKLVIPDLLEVIASSVTSAISRANAIWLVFSIYSREDLIEAIHVLKRAAKPRESIDWAASQRLLDAAQGISGMCSRDMAKVCLDVFYDHEP